jgi:hypothetical protein
VRGGLGVVATSLTRECDGFRRDKVGPNVARLIDAPVADEHEIEPFMREEARRILDPAKGHRNAARWSVALVLGIRQGAALGLRLPIEQGVPVRVTTTERYTQVASPRSATRVPS